VWGRSPDISEWRDVVLESTEVAPDGQRLPYVQMNKPPVRRDRDRPYIAFETQSDQFPPWLSSCGACGLRSARVQWIAFVAIVVGYWALFAAYPVRPDFDYPAVGVPADWPHLMSGFLAHWNKNSNPAGAFDVWFLNLFPGSEPFRDNGGGYATLNFIPTLATMIRV
jgi:heparan-alpha-glucosaminide N-acetyltransferase